MNHQPFEDWLLSKETLDPEQKAGLNQHLQSCSNCANLAAAWQAVEQEIAHTPQAAPAPGFTTRWQARLAEKRAQRQRRIAWWVIALSLLGALGFFLLPNWQRITSLSLSQLLVSGLYSLTLLFARIDSAEVLFRLFLREVNPVIPIAVVSSFATILSVLSLIWIASLVKIYNPLGVQHEARH